MGQHVNIHVQTTAMVTIVINSQDYVVAPRASQELIVTNVSMGNMGLSVLCHVPQDVKMIIVLKPTERAPAKQIIS